MLAPEARLLIAACGLRDPHGEDVAALLEEPIDWTALQRLAKQEKVSPLLARALRPFWPAVPVEAATRLRTIDAATTFRSLAYEAAAADVVRRFAALDIPVILLKGAALGLTVYGVPDQRPMGDMDLLLPAGRTHDGWRALRLAGWVPERKGNADFFAQHHHLPPLMDPRGRGIVVELHRHLVSPELPFDIDEAELWRTAKPVTVGGQRAFVLAPAHQLLHLCIHFAWSHHMMRGLVRTARDCSALLNACPLDWDAFVRLASTRRAASLCFWTFELARLIADVPVPAEVMRALRRSGRVRLVGPIGRRLLDSAFPAPGKRLSSVTLERVLWQAAVRPRALGVGARRPWHAGVRWLVRPKPIHRRIRLAMRQLSRWSGWARAGTG